ncbi:DsbA family protein [Deinococcus taeanensis]|uniref:DsbA family protein n=1 Tax=Deinococcus taeanensis TaxID=2737050 RepID=UPI001CDB9D6C|nr:DsbA family protein [Deinococcus taeanensis]UBV43207.1 DsbA family protein [Deinococcus taeanensis]
MSSTLRGPARIMILSVLLGTGASAQLMATPGATAAQPLLSGFNLQGLTFHSASSTVTLDVVGGLVVGVLTQTDSIEGLARGIGAGWGLEAANLPKLQQSLSDPKLLTAARQGFVDVTDEGATDLIALKVTGDASAPRYLGYVAMKVWPDSAFPPAWAVTGSAEAPNVLRIFSDFQCPYCKLMWDKAMPAWRKASGTYRVVHYEFPLSFHRNALGAAEASECALAQGKFWPFADQLFANAATWTPLNPKDAPGRYSVYARAAGLDTAAFKTCLGQRTFKTSVDAQYRVGLSLGVQGTPTVFLNGMKLTDYGDMQEFARIRAVTTARPGAASVIEERLRLFR